MAVKHAMAFFVAAATLCYLMPIHPKAAVSSSVAGSKPLRSSPHFDSFVLFGQVYPYNLKEITRHKLQLSVELGNHMWLQDVKSKYYTFQLPTRNYSGLVGRLSILACDNYATAFWNHSFMVQNDVGAYRLDVNMEEALGSTNGQEHYFEDLHGSNKARVHRQDINAEGTAGSIISQGQLSKANIANINLGSKGSTSRRRVEIEQVATHPFGNFLTRSHQDMERARNSNIMPEKDTQVLQMVYPQQLLLYSASIQKWHLIVFVACFAMVKLLNSLVHKSMFLLEASFLSTVQVPEGEVATLSDINDAAWQLCRSNSLQTEREFFNSKNSRDTECTGNSSLEEAWHVAEQYLNESIDNNCQGAYFSYNCTTPQAHQERHESAMGRWNRDNAGRLIRQLWSE